MSERVKVLENLPSALLLMSVARLIGGLSKRISFIRFCGPAEKRMWRTMSVLKVNRAMSAIPMAAAK